HVDARDNDGKTPLHIATEADHADNVWNLINEGANFNEQDGNGMTALHHAAHSGFMDVAKTLTERGCDYSISNNAGMTALDVALGGNLTALREFIAERERSQIRKALKDHLSPREIERARTEARAKLNGLDNNSQKPAQRQR